MKNHFYISYPGNKREEVENIYNLIDLNDITTIVEPFCGTCAMSFYISTKHPKKYKYIINDNNEYLKEMFDIIRDDERTKEFEEELKKLFQHSKIIKKNIKKL